jgi:hypothetical protein
MPERMSHEDYVAMQRRHVAAVARQILTREVDIFDASWEIAGLRGELEIDFSDDDLMAFVLVVSETDTLPVGVEALNWSKEALARKEPEVRHAREWAFNTVRRPCENFIARFGDA